MSQWSPLAAAPRPADAPPRLIAVDLGLRTGVACFGADGTLRYARARRFANRTRLRAAIPSLLTGEGPLAWVVVEGDPALARLWTRAAERLGAQTLRVAPHVWRDALLLPRERRSGQDAKSAALRDAQRLLADAGRSPVVPLKHDAAEAALIGLWALSQVTWPSASPAGAREAAAGPTSRDEDRRDSEAPTGQGT